jgi:hypothetical protein
MSYAITNSWTHADHGHALDELLSIKQFLQSNAEEVVIVSTNPNFGDLRMPSIGYRLHRLRLDHSRLFKPKIDSKLMDDLIAGLEKVVAIKSNKNLEIVITSSRLNNFFQLEKLAKRKIRLRIRMLDSPKTTEEWVRFLRCSESLSSDSVIAMEVKSSVIESQQYLDGVIHVPSHYGMQTESASINTARDRVGIFWPVGRSFSVDKVLNFLNYVDSLKPIVKLPNHMNSKEFRKMFPRIEFVEKGLGNMQFRAILSKVKVAILGHRGYTNQSSGYAGYFLANNVPIFVSSSNSFFDEIKNLGQVYDLENSLDQNLGLVTSLLDRDLILERNPYAILVEDIWKTFLLEQKI